MNRRKFIGTCACCAFASAGATFLNLNNSAQHWDDFIMHHVEVHLNEHCNLNCKYCFHFSCIAEKEFYELDRFKQDMAQMAAVFKGHLKNIQLLGGEPLLNPQVNEYIKVTRKLFPKSTISLLTNATLLDNMDKDFWVNLNENNVNIVPSIYPVKINWASIIDKAKKYNVIIYGDYNCQEELRVDTVDKYRKNKFLKLELNEKGNVGVDNSNCSRKFRCNNMYHGKFYPCSAIVYVRHLNKKFNTNFVVTENDYIDLYKVKNINEVKEFLKKPQPFCDNYCKVCPKKVDWELVKEHTLSEWT